MIEISITEFHLTLALYPSPIVNPLWSSYLPRFSPLDLYPSICRKYCSVPDAIKGKHLRPNSHTPLISATPSLFSSHHSGTIPPILSINALLLPQAMWKLSSRRLLQCPGLTVEFQRVAFSVCEEFRFRPTTRGDELAASDTRRYTEYRWNGYRLLQYQKNHQHIQGYQLLFFL